MSHDRWLASGGLDLTEKARAKARELLATHRAPDLPAELVARLDAVVPGA